MRGKIHYSHTKKERKMGDMRLMKMGRTWCDDCEKDGPTEQFPHIKYTKNTIK